MGDQVMCPHGRDDRFIRRPEVVVRGYAAGGEIAVEAIRELAAWPLECATCLETVATEELARKGDPLPIERLKGGARRP